MCFQPYVEPLELACHFLPIGLYFDAIEAPSAIFAAVERETKKVEGFGLSKSPFTAVRFRKSPKLQYFRLFQRQLQVESPESFYERRIELLRIFFVLEAADKVVAIAYEICLAFALFLERFLKPLEC